MAEIFHLYLKTISHFLPNFCEIPNNVKPFLIKWILGVLNLGIKQPECETDHSSPPGAEV